MIRTQDPANLKLVLYERGYYVLVKIVQAMIAMARQRNINVSIDQAGDKPLLEIKQEGEADKMDVDEAGDKEVEADDKVVECETVIKVYTDENNKHEPLCFFNKGLVNKF